MEPQHKNEKITVKLPCWFWLLIIAVCGATAWLGYYVLLHESKVGWPSFDALAALFSGLAFVGLLGALHVQREELKLQKQELIETRQVLLQTAQANKESAELAKKNLRAQFLMFWIESYKNFFSKYYTITMDQEIIVINGVEHLKCMDTGEVFPPSFVENHKENKKILEQFLEYKIELDSLTEEIKTAAHTPSDTPSPH